MAIRIDPPVCLNEKGKRKNNEDSIYPRMGAGTDSNKLFLVCDGVGGANKGEVASAMVCDLFHAYFAEHPNKDVDANYIGQALRFVEARMSKHSNAHPECGGMATTLTLLHLDDRRNKATLAWVGDSRIYHIREGKIQSVTDDHSLVNELVKRGEINPEDAAIHPQRNVILRAISGSEQPTKADINEITDIQAGDYFFLCSDGILESIDDVTLGMLLPNAETNLDTVKLQIRELCEHLSNDNFSMYLLRVTELTPVSATLKTGELKMPSQDLSSLVPKNNTAILPVSNQANETQNTAATITKNNTDQGSNKMIMILAGVALLAFMALGLYWLSASGNEKKYKQYKIVADSLFKEQKWEEAESYYHKAAALFPDRNEIIKQIDQIAIQKQAQHISDSLKIVKNELLTDTILLQKANITPQAIEEAFAAGDEGMLQNIKEKLDTLRNQPTTPIDKVIERNAIAQPDSAE